MIAPRHSTLALLLACACAPAATVPRAPAGQPARAEATSPEVAARLLRLEDRREYDAAAFDALSASPRAADRRHAA
ncbi:MAG: hypothetical protein ICV87_13535, partial [Gemmatimonadetes bacterium]|nr:hypothetical protein [Gemmatimonadota bacterium]